MKKIKILLFLLVTLSILFIWQKPLISYSAEFLLFHFSEKFLGQRITCENISIQNGQIILEKPSLGSMCHANQASLSFFLHPTTLSADLDIVVESPELDLKKGIFDSIPILNNLGTSSWIKVNTHFVMNNGKFRQNDTSMGNIDIDLKCGNELSGRVTGQAIPCPYLADFFRTVFPHGTEWYIEDGWADGEVRFTTSEKAPSFLEGTLTLKRLAAHYAPLSVDISIPEALIVLQHGEATNGKIDLVKPAVISAGEMGWEQISGTITLSESGPAKISLSGFSRVGNTQKPLNIEGLLTKDHDSELKMLVGEPQHPETSAQINIKNPTKNKKQLDLVLHQIGPLEFYLLQTAIHQHLPAANTIHLMEGKINADIHANVIDSELHHLAVDKLNASDLSIEVASWPLSVDVRHLGGALALDFTTSDLLESLHSDLTLSDGQVRIKQLNTPSWHFTNIQTKLLVEKGIVHHSQASVELGGLKGILDLDWTSLNPLSIVFKGTGLDLVPFLPEEFGKIFLEHFSKENLALKSNIRKKDGGLEIDGVIEMLAGNFVPAHLVPFGFELHSVKEKPQLLLSPAIISKLTPPIASPVMSLVVGNIKSQSGIAGYVVKNGWFKTRNLPLDHYIAPLLFPDNFFKLTGIATDVSGTFDHTQLKLRYNCKDLNLENEDLNIHVPTIGLPDHQNLSYATHTFNFESGFNLGYLPASSGSYFEKNSGLMFTDIKSLVVFEGKKIHIVDADSYCNGLFFHGHVDIDYSSPDKGVFDVAIFPEIINGKFSQVQHLFSHFDRPFFFLKLPLEGNVAYNGHDGLMRFSFYPGDYDLQAKIRGTLTDGILRSNEKELSLQDLSVHFEYDHEGNTLAFTDIQGTLLVGKPEHVEEYYLAGDQIRFTDYQHNESNFDLWVGDKHRDIIRVAGKTHDDGKDAEGEKVRFELDHKLTHFGNVHPKILDLTLRNWSDVEKFNLDVQFQLNTLFHDLQRFSRTGLLFISPKIIQEINQIPSAKGDIDIAIDFDRTNGIMDVSGTGSDIALGDLSYKTCILKGRKENKTWIVDQFQLDDLTLAADILHQEGKWDVNFLGIRYGNILLMGLAGSFNEENNRLEASLNLFDVDLTKLKETKAIANYVDSLDPKGILRAQGSLTFDLFQNAQLYRLDSTIKASLRGVSLKGWTFHDNDHIDLHYVSDKGFSIENANISLLEEGGSSIRAMSSVDSVEHLFSQNSWKISGFKFEVPAEHLEWISKRVQETFPDAASPSLGSAIASAKRSGFLKGIFDLEFSPSSHVFRFSLDDDTYLYRNTEYLLHNFALEYTPAQLKFSGKTQFKQCPIWFVGKAKSVEKDRGELVLIDHDPTHPIRNLKENLVITWQKDLQGNFNVEKAKGIISGVNLDLHNIPSENETDSWITLDGIVNFEGPAASDLVCDEIAQKMAQWKIGKGYSLTGKWLIQRETKNGASPDIQFQGSLEGKNFQIRGYQLDNLTADVAFTPEDIQIKKLLIRDAAGSVNIPEISCKKDPQNIWNINIPLLTAQEFRPSILQMVARPSRGSHQPLLIRDLQIENIQGTLDPQPNLQGSGTLHFVNPSKKNFQNTIFAIPAEIMLRVGLDLRLLTPVVGTINYEIKGDKVYLTKFKDVFSDGRGSKFYLPHSNTDDSWVDFDGNLNVRVRMKQYNLVFKIAELFTVTINGTLRNPTYTLQKQKSKEKK